MVGFLVSTDLKLQANFFKSRVRGRLVPTVESRHGAERHKHDPTTFWTTVPTDRTSTTVSGSYSAGSVVVARLIASGSFHLIS